MNCLPSERSVDRHLAAQRRPIATRRTAVDQMYLHGDPLEEIAKRLGVSVSTISRDLTARAAAWQRHLRDNARSLRAIELDCQLPVAEPTQRDETHALLNGHF